ncbi:AMP-binding protein [Shewanella indica]|uniref:AMP-binding protein n=1 Tax=Shewanella indica TaxID=768528 RepID=A0ABU4QE83_9GAMM|nr:MULTISPECIES: AMP-binding protein [Shewanella]MDX6016913.1 AMP-binding protein [Shewanella indica]NDO76085.1 long-chain fatty acid--CoA ligase [Shewanella sp. SE1]
MTPSPQLNQANISESGTGTNLDWDVLGKLNGEDQAIALSDAERQLSYLELKTEIRRYSDFLKRLNIRSLALHAGNSVQWAILDLACQQAGVLCLPLPLFFSQEQLANCLEQTSVELVLSESPQIQPCLPKGFAPYQGLSELGCNLYGWQLYDERLSEGQLCDGHPGQQSVCAESRTAFPQVPQGTAKITFTSGSTGNPKGVCLSSEHQWRVAESLAKVTALPSPRHLCLLPLSTLLENIAGIYSPLLCGGTVLLPSDKARGMHGSSRLDSRALLQTISQAQPSSMILIPQLLTLLVGACEQGWQAPNSLRFVAVGGGKVAPELLMRARELGLPVYEGYGLSECGSVVALNTPDKDTPGFAGTVLPHCKVTIRGCEIHVSGASHLGYLGQPETWGQGEVATGDLGLLDKGVLAINGRRKHLLISSFGRNISPEWVESALMAKPLLSQCMVLGDARPWLSALLCAPHQVSDEQLQTWLDAVNATLPDYARIKRWIRLNETELKPHTTANGRVKRASLLSALAAQIEQLYLSETPYLEGTL